jgi:Inner membrane component of T3SS, cytoplasmic domain
MGRLIVQIAARNPRAQEFARSDGQMLTVGRGFANDLVLSDLYVAPDQLRFDYQDDHWTVAILDRTNAVLLNGVAVTDDTVAVKSGDRMTVGRTELAIFTEHHAVDSTRKLLSSWFTPERVTPWHALGVLLAVSVFDVVTEFMQSSVDLEWKNYLYAGLFSTALLAAWAGLWAIAGRLLRHQPHFFVQLLVTTLVGLGCIFLFPIVDYLAFLTSSVAVNKVAYYVVGIAALTILLRLNLSFATNVRNTGLAALIFSCSVVGLGYAASRYMEEEFETEPDYSEVIKPPFAHLSGDRSIEEFLAEARREAKKL